MKIKQTISLGMLIIIILAGGITYIQYDNVKYRIDNDKAVFYVNESRWLISALQEDRLFSGAKIIDRVKSTIIRKNYTEDNLRFEYRYTGYKNNESIEHIWKFDPNTKNIEDFPYEEKICISNAKGKYYRYSLKKLYGSGLKRKLINETSASFGRNMKVTFEPDYSWAWIGWPYGKNSFSVQYKITSDYECFDVRLFDPPDYTQRTCSEVWGSDCGTLCGSEADNTYDTCSNCYNADERINEIYLNGTVFEQDDTIGVTCEYYTTETTNDELYVVYRNSTSATWVVKCSGSSSGTGRTIRNWTTCSIPVDDINGTHQARCIIDYEGEADECAGGGGYYDNDDINFTVISPSENVTLSINLSYGLDVSVFRFETCGADFENATAVPQGQNSSHGIDYVCNDGDAGAGDIQIKLSGALNSNWTWWASNTSISVNLIELNTSYQTIYSPLAENSCTYIWHKANCSYVNQGPGVYEQYRII